MGASVAETSIIVRRWILAINPDGTENALTFDSVIREAHTSELAVTDNPVETGVVMSDHAYMQPRRLTMEGAFSNTPMQEGGIPNSALVSGNSIKPKDDGGDPRSSNAWDVLTALQKLAVPFDVQTGLVLYKNMMLMRLTCDQDKETVGALYFSAELREVQYATSQTVTYAARAPKRGQPKKKVVTKPTKDPTDAETKKKNTSLLLQGAQALGLAP
jgi:hypothetical protein